MKNNVLRVSCIASLLLSGQFSFAATSSVSVPQSSPCMAVDFTKEGDAWWSNISLKITNLCGKSVDLQNVAVTFNNAEKLNTSFWGTFGSIAYPDSQLQITSQPSTQGYLATLSLHFPEQSWANSKLAHGSSIILQYGGTATGYDASSAKVYLNGQTVQVGNIDLTNSTAKPTGVSQDAWVSIKNETQVVSRVQIPWGNVKKQITGLAPDTYTILPENVTDNQGAVFTGSATPMTVKVKADEAVSTTLSYVKVAQNGKVKVQVQTLPQALAGYTGNPEVVLTRKDTNATLTKTTPWNATTTIDQLANATYTFSAAMINHNSQKCTPSFSPVELASHETNPLTTQLSYKCEQVKQNNISIDVSGAPDGTSSVDLAFTPNDSSAKVTKTLALSAGKGNDTVKLTDGVIYNVSASQLDGYNVSFNPQPLTSTANASLKATYKKVTGGRIIGFYPTWVEVSQRPTAKQLSEAGYTHIMVAFGLFSTTNPGQINVELFQSMDKAYVDSLHNEGIKVILSLGGALSTIPNASVNFHEVIAKSQSPEKFKSDFIASLKNVINTFGFDGFDIDIEHGLGAGGTFAQPSATSDIGIMASIINQMYAENPNLIITLTPQTANVAATSGFDGTWGNYSSLIMQTYKSLSWVGIQLYNTGCTYGINQICYANTGGNDPTYSVAMATDLLENWPAKVDGRNTGFQPYISYLRPDQVVLGYPAANSGGDSDGRPTTSATGIKKAIQCLKTGSEGCTPTSSSGYTPPRAYGEIGGVFNWEVTYDQSNQFKFAKDLKSCVKEGNC